MELAASGDIASVAGLDDEGRPQHTWKCPLCCKMNTPTSEGGSIEPDKCACCGRDREPSWLRVGGKRLQLDTGVIFQLPNDSAFGVRIGIAVAVDYHRCSVQVLALSSEEECLNSITSSSGQRRKLQFDMIKIDRHQVQNLVAIAPEDNHVKELVTIIGYHRVCCECQRIFRTTRGWDNEDRENHHDKIQALEDEITRLKAEKAQNFKLRDYRRVLANSSELKHLDEKVTVMKRGHEILGHVSCPHCGRRQD